MSIPTTAITKATNATAIKWAMGGWSFFIAENLILSENRTYIINQLGDDNYHYIYGTFSTAAMASIGYGYLYKIKNAGPYAWKLGTPAPMGAKAGSFFFTALALGMVSQTLPKFQIPIHYVDSSNAEGASATTETLAQPLPQGSSGDGTGTKWKVRCPFDFTDSKTQTNYTGSGDHDGSSSEIHLKGLDRVSRHPGLWSFGLLGLGSALLTPSLPSRIWMSMPLMVALIGGSHTDSRHRRGMGGNLCARVDEKTSNVPFLAIVSGKQGNVMKVFGDLADEVKVLNAVISAGVAAAWVARRGRGGAVAPAFLR